MRWGLAPTVALAMMLLLTPWVRAGAPQCPQPTRITSSVNLVLPEPRLRTDVSFAQLRSLGGSAYRPHGAEGMHTVGLARSQLRTSVTFSKLTLNGAGGACSRVTHIQARIALENLEVIVAREIPRGTCGWTVVRAHEMEHVSIDRRVLTRLRPRIRSYLIEAAVQLGPVRGRSAEEAGAHIRRYLEEALDQVMRGIEKQRHDAHARLDTLDEYTRLSTVCGGQIGRLLGRYQHR